MSVPSFAEIAMAFAQATATATPSGSAAATGETATGPVMRLDGAELWVAVGVVAVFFLAVGVFVALGPKSPKGSTGAGESGQADRSYIRSWLAVGLVGGLVIFSALSLGIDDTAARNVLLGALIANAGAASAFYFASKASDQARKDILSATVSTSFVPDLVGRDAAAVRAALASTPFRLVSRPPEPNDSMIATAQRPGANQSAVPGSAIDVTFEEPPPGPDDPPPPPPPPPPPDDPPPPPPDDPPPPPPDDPPPPPPDDPPPPPPDDPPPPPPDDPPPPPPDDPLPPPPDDPPPVDPPPVEPTPPKPKPKPEPHEPKPKPKPKPEPHHDEKPLKQGDRGPAVKAFQVALNCRAEPRFYPAIPTDGEFGPNTRYAFEALGYALGLTADTVNADAVSVGAQRIVEDPGLRNDEQLARARERADSLHLHTVAFDGTPTFWGLAKTLMRARARGWTGTLQSSDRRKGVPERYGKRSQAALFACAELATKRGGRCPSECGGNCNPANPPGESSHECRSDGTAFGNRAKGAELSWWELGIDVSDTDGLLRELKELGYSAKRTYPNSVREAHHINLTKSPGPVLPPSGPNAKPPDKPKPTPTHKPTKHDTRVLTGVDVSNHQPDVNWEKVKAAGHRFAFVKVSEGLRSPDTVFGPGRWKAMREAGLVRGAYHFARPQTGRDPKTEVHEFLELVERAGGFQDGDLLPVLDIEDFGAAGRLTAKQTHAWAAGFVEEMHAKLGRRPIIYTGNFWRDAMANPADDLDCPLWLAAYVENPKPFVPHAWTNRSYAIWQHTQSGTCPGVPGKVDLNRLPGGEPALRRLRF